MRLEEDFDHVASLRKIAAAMVATLLAGTVGYWVIGKAHGYVDWSFFHCVYMTFMTLFTVGYADTLGIEGKSDWLALGFTGLLLITGTVLGVVGVSRLTAIFVGSKMREHVLHTHSLLRSEHGKQLFYLVAVLIGMLLFGTLGYWIIGITHGYEGWGLFSCAYMTLVTLSTVGYGDTLSIEAKDSWIALGFTGLIMAFGMGIVVYCMSQVTAIIVGGELREHFKRSKMSKEISDLSGHYIVCGAGNTGGPLIEELVTTGREVIVVDTDRERLDELHDRVGVKYVEGDCLDDDDLIAAGIQRAAGIFAILPEDKDNLFVTVTARGLNSRLRIVSKAIDPKMSTKLVRSGANAVVSPNTIGGLRMASEMVRPSVVKFLDRMLRGKVPHRIEEIQIQEGSELDGKTLREAHIHKRTGLLIIAVMYLGSEDVIYNPSGDVVIDSKTVLVTCGSPDQLAEVHKMSHAKA